MTPSSRTAPRRRWRNLAVAAGLALLAAALLLAMGIALITARAARNALSPPRIEVDVPDGDLPQAMDVVFTTGDGITLRGWYVPSENGAVVILAHGYAGNHRMLLPEAALLAAHGYGVLLFDFRGHGESGDGLVTIGDRERRDLEAAVDFVAARPDADPDRIGAIGFSMGGATLAQVAAQDSRLRAVVIEAAFASLDATIRYRSRYLGPLTQWPSLWAVRRAGVDVDDVTPVADLCAISPRPVLLIYGERDSDVPPGTAQAMYEAACEPVEQWMVVGARHQNYMEVAPQEYAARLLGFFGRWLLVRAE
jgi:dipeptidyl aminopeptidase/acylaminoacyl peptidase